MTSNALFSDVVLPAATWYEKYDLSSTDLHPFVHTFNQAVPPPWEAKSDWDAFALHRRALLRAGRDAPRRPPRPRRRAAAARHAGRDRPAAGRGARLARRGVRAGPGQDDAEADRRRARLPARGREAGAALGPLVEELGTAVKGASWVADEEVARAARAPTARSAAASPTGARRCARVEHACEAILALSGTTNGRLAVEGFRSLERTHGRRAGRPRRPARGRPDHASHDAQVQPRTVITSPEWSGIEAHGRRYAPFTTNVEREKPWHTLSGRQHFYLDHAWMLELGEGLPVFRPPLHHRAIFGDQGAQRRLGTRRS